jgi:hypothetical protein
VPLDETRIFCADKKQDVRHRKLKLFQFMKLVQQKVLPQINEELFELLPEWGDLLEIDGGLVCVHTLGVIYCVMHD